MALENKKLDKEEKTPDLAWLDDPEVFRVGQIKAHSDHHWNLAVCMVEESGRASGGFLPGRRRCIRIWNHPGARTYGTGWF